MKAPLAVSALLLTVAAYAEAQPPATAGAAPVIENPASTINEALPPWMSFGGDYRARFEGYSGGSFKHHTTDDYLLSRLKLQMTIHPTKWLRFFGEGMDARALEKNPAVPTYQNTWDIRQAYAELGSFDHGFGLRAGRQEMIYGEQRLIGASAWTNTERNWDAVHGSIRYGGYRADLFSGSIVNNVTGTWDHHQQGNNLHGIYGGIDRFGPRLVIEPYGMWRLQHGLRDEAGTIGKLNEKVGGMRVAGSTLPGGWEYSIEMVREWGSLGSDRIQAWAGHWYAGKTLAMRFEPHLTAEYNFATGDRNATDGTRGTFDQLYPSGHDKLGFSDQVGWRNIKDFRAVVEMKPKKNVIAAFEYNDWHLASATDWLYNSGGAGVFHSANGSAGTHVGQEIDLTGTWIFAKAFTAGAGVAHIFPGEFLKAVTPGNPYTYPFMVMTYRF
ncbi:MAG TPA: alginate export family protein [Bryobacteraceae bacterium]|nr:alginate export family protein [Bryobacteraceae bacterium]